MIEAGSLEYACGRLGARHGKRPDAGLWRRIEMLRDFAAVVATVRASVLSPWIAGVGPGAEAHMVEAAMRHRWRGLVAEVAGWMPSPWPDAVRWCAVLADLPVLLHLGHGGARLPWIAQDPVYGELLRCANKDGDRPSAALMDAAAGEPRELREAWRNEWERRLPPGATASPRLAALLALLTAHAQSFPATPRVAGWSERRALQARLISLFHRAAAEPAAAFVHLALCALEYERLRAELLRRRVFPRRVLTA